MLITFTRRRAGQCALAVAGVLALVGAAQGAVTGTVFQDYNGNGLMDTTTMVSATVSGAAAVPAAVDVGVGGVTVRATGVVGLGADGVINTADDVIGDCGAGAVTTAANGSYSMATSSCYSGAKIRIEFSGWSTPYQAGLGGGTTVQFVKDGATAVNLPLVNPSLYCENNPLLATNCYAAFDQLTGVNKAQQTLLTFPYGASGTTATNSSPLANKVTMAQQTGSTWGLAYQAARKRLFAASFFKNRTGFGPNGPGAIYQIDPKTGATSLFVDINALPDTGSGYFGAGAAGTDPFGAHTEADYNSNAVLQSGGQVAWGDIDLNADQSRLYALNQKNLRVYSFPTASALLSTAAGIDVLPALPWTNPAVNCAGARSVSGFSMSGPFGFGMGVYNNALYVGAACQNPYTNSVYYVFRYDLAQGATGSWTVALKQNMSTSNNLFPAGGYGYEIGRGIIADIAFVGGDMVLALRGLGGDFSPSAEGFGSLTGAQLLACANDAAGTTYTMEKNGVCTSAINGARAGQLVTTGATAGQYFGPQDAADGNKYWNVGGLAVVPGHADVAATVYDPFKVYEAGVAWFSANNGALLKRYTAIDQSTSAMNIGYNTTQLGAKRGILGDIEALCNTAPVEIGNRVWKDLNGNGLQDPNEPPIAGVTVELRDSSSALIATAVTDSNGQYLFSNDPRGYTNGVNNAPNNTISNGGYVEDSQGGTASTAANRYGIPFVSGSTYSVVIPNASGAGQQAALAGLSLTPATQGANTALDSNFSAAGTSATASVTIGAPGANNHTIDAGFVAAATYGLGNRIWFDTNNNGRIDAGEAAIPNVLVELLDGSGNVIKTTVTSASGEYLFESLAAGNYTVRVAKENWTGLTAGQVSAAGSPSGLAAGQKPLGGYNNSTGAGGVGATATDATDKGVDAADPTVAGISSAQVTLGAGQQPLNESTTADNDGVGSATSSDANNNMTIDFGFYRLTVGDLIWRDDGNNGATPGNVNNGVRDSGEAGLAGVRVELYLDATLVAVTTTDSNGNYLFDQGTDSTGVVNGKPLVPGTTYQVRIPQATATVNAALINLLSSAANVTSETTPLGANDDDSGVGVGAASAGITPSANFTLGAGANADASSVATNSTGTTAQPNVDFGFTPSYSLGNRVWVDANNNGTMDGSEVGLANVTVRLLDASGNPVAGVANQTTGSNGYYRFDGLQPGNYIVEIVPGAVNGVNYVSSTGQNASASGPYEAGINATAASSNDRDHGTQSTPTTIRSNPITLGPTNLVSGEVNAGASNAGANGPNGDMFDVLTGDFGVFLPAKLGNLVWFDNNRNGTADPGESGINDVTIILYDGNGKEVARQLSRNNPTTNTPGYYQFDYLVPGNYSVAFLPGGNYQATVPGTPAITTGSGPDTNNNQLPAGNQVTRTKTVTLGAGDNNPQLDAGFYLLVQAIPTLTEAMRLLLSLLLFSASVVTLRRLRR